MQHHPDVLHEITDELASMGLDVLKADVTHTMQPTHGVTPHHMVSATESTTAPANKSPDASARRSGGSRPMSRSNSKSDLGQAAEAAIAQLETEAHERANDGNDLDADGVRFFAIDDKERAIFYAREADGTHQVSAARRGNIQAKLEKIVHEHGLHGTVLVRVVHEREMQMHSVVPKFDHEDRMVIVRCTGEHHKELLHEICDAVHAAQLDVIHAEMDLTRDGKEEHALYVSRSDGTATTYEQRTSLRVIINELYSAHQPPSPKNVHGSPGEWARSAIGLPSPPSG